MCESSTFALLLLSRNMHKNFNVNYQEFSLPPCRTSHEGKRGALESFKLRLLWRCEFIVSEKIFPLREAKSAVGDEGIRTKFGLNSLIDWMNQSLKVGCVFVMQMTAQLSPQQLQQTKFKVHSHITTKTSNRRALLWLQPPIVLWKSRLQVNCTFKSSTFDCWISRYYPLGQQPALSSCLDCSNHPVGVGKRFSCIKRDSSTSHFPPVNSRLWRWIMVIDAGELTY